MVRLLKILGFAFIALLLFAVLAGWMANEPRPQGQAGPEADALAEKMQAAVDTDAWRRTGAVRWSFHDVHHYVWDRRRGLVEASWRDRRVLLRTADQSGRAWKGDEELSGDAQARMLRRAYQYWINDAFWLNPIGSFFDQDVRREMVSLPDGETGLLVTYGSGGVTPGDSYLWTADEQGLPEQWRMWVQILPIGGLATSWEGWEELRTGAKIATRHGGLGMNFTFITNLDGAESLEELGLDEDPFSPLF
jgi:hypothetical protein